MDSGMLEGVSELRVASMTRLEKRLFSNLKKAFYESDRAYKGKTPEDNCIRELCNAVDVAKKLRRSLQGLPADNCKNRKRYLEFLDYEIPRTSNGGLGVELFDEREGKKKHYSFGEIVYDIRCMIHENENLNAAEMQDYHITLDWSKQSETRTLCWVSKDTGKMICNGHLVWRRLRQVLAKFITSIDALEKMSKGQAFCIQIDPPLCSINPEK